VLLLYSYAELSMIIHCGWFRWTHPTNYLTHLRSGQIDYELLHGVPLTFQ
jgi:hypothetical protein